MPSARTHHWIPQFYLRQFGDPETSQVFVVDLVDRRAYRTSPKNICAERDFNRVDAEGLSPDALETSLSTFENSAAAAVRELVASPRHVGAENWILILNLMSLLATRNPVTRKQRERVASNAVLGALDEAIETPEKWETLMKAAKATGDVAADVPLDYEKHREFIRERRFELTFEPSYHVVGEFDAQDVVLRSLHRRRWLLLEAGSDSRGFITTDRPVCLSNCDGSYPTAGPLLFETAGTCVMFPICPRLLAYGTFDGREGITQIDRRLVAKANLTMLQYCDRRIFAPHDRFEVNSLGKTPYVAGADVLNIVLDRVSFVE